MEMSGRSINAKPACGFESGPIWENSPPTSGSDAAHSVSLLFGIAVVEVKETEKFTA